MKSTDGRQILGLDHLRALAALLVLYWHGIHQLGIPTETVPRNWVMSLFEEGWVGVSLFITITGFMFTVLTHGKEIDYLPFLRNRLLRLLPLIFIVTLYSVQVDKTSTTAIFTFFNLLGGGAVFGTWTLIIEFQFYLAYPFLRGRLLRGNAKQIIAACTAFVAIFVMFRIAFYVQTGEVQNFTYGTIFGRVDEFVGGIVAGLIYLHFRGRKSLGMWVVFSVSVIILLLLQHLFNKTGGFYHRPTYPSPSRLWIIWPTVSSIVCGSLICSYCLVSQNWSGRMSRIVAYLGSISYSMYMLHLITLPMATALWKTHVNLVLSDNLLTQGTILLLIWHLPITVAVSSASYELIEKAFLRRRSPYLFVQSPPATPPGGKDPG